MLSDAPRTSAFAPGHDHRPILTELTKHIEISPVHRIQILLAGCSCVELVLMISHWIRCRTRSHCHQLPLLCYPQQPSSFRCTITLLLHRLVLIYPPLPLPPRLPRINARTLRTPPPPWYPRPSHASSPAPCSLGAGEEIGRRRRGWFLVVQEGQGSVRAVEKTSAVVAQGEGMILTHVGVTPTVINRFPPASLLLLDLLRAQPVVRRRLAVAHRAPRQHAETPCLLLSASRGLRAIAVN